MKRLACFLSVLILLLSPTFAQQAAQQQVMIGQKISAAASDFVTDTFTGSDTTALEDHTGEVGATWTHHPAAAYAGNQCFIASNRIYKNNTSAYYASGSPPSANYYVLGDFNVISVLSTNFGIALRMDTTADTMYLVRLNNDTSWDLRLINAGTASTLGTSGTNLPSIGNPVTVKLTANGTTLTVNAGGTDIISVTDATISAAGKAGVRGSGIDSPITGYHIDNFSAR